MNHYLALGDTSQTVSWLNTVFGNVPALATEAEPAVRQMLAQYAEASPYIEWFLDWWPLVMLALFVLFAGAAGWGAYLGERIGR